MQLNISERLTLVNVLPEKGNFETMKVIEALKDVLYPSEEESKKFQIVTEGNSVSWNAEGAKEVDIKISKAQKELLADCLLKLDEKEELTFAHYSVYKKFKSK